MSNNTFDQMKTNQMAFLQSLLVNYTVKMKKEEDCLFIIKIKVEGNYEVEPNYQTGEWDVTDNKKVYAKYTMAINTNLVSEKGFEIIFKDCNITVNTQISNVRQFLISIQKLPEGEWIVGEEDGKMIATQKIELYEAF